MKLSAITVMFVAATAVAAEGSKKIFEVEGLDTWNEQEAKDLLQCSVTTLNAFDRGVTGNKASCNMFRCLQNYADTYNRGGVFQKLSQILDIVCVLPF
ncbi:uncharacterized protein N7484_008478 [Penicillium longicatenatum]|uniref:uncharacterized protein n=1 Tax=Penicillium longicatenatum TaxID=1561947 RepID=UPI002546B3AC|nr:uncharacterized protein N7484_008478 [Penicillium longicatenatum]KAJ5635165.1 hypothetical protein N7484_008478 [Penicillium longicatenatum]